METNRTTPIGHRMGLIICAVVSGTVSLIWPGDIPWGRDEPLLMLNALVANDAGLPARLGFSGHMGLTYGPLPIWIYQGLTAISRNLILVAGIKAAVSWSLTSAALIMLVRRTGTWLGWLALPLFSPYLYFYHRLPWDNVMLIPVSAWMAAFTAGFLQKPDRWALTGVLVTMVAALYIHLMGAFSVLAVAGGLIAFEGPWLNRNRRFVLTASLATMIASMPYLANLYAGSPSDPVLPSALWENAARAILGGGHLSSFGFADYFLPEFYAWGGWTKPLAWSTGLIVILPLAGLARLGVRLTEQHRRRESLALSDRLTVIAATATVLHTGFFLLSRHPLEPHYFNGVWIWGFWLAVYGGQPWGRWAQGWICGHAAATAGLLIGLALFIHVHGGNRGIHYGATLANQLQVADDLRACRCPLPPEIEILQYRLIPHALRTLLLLPYTGPVVDFPAQRCRIEYSDGKASTSGRIRLRCLGHNHDESESSESVLKP